MIKHWNTLENVPNYTVKLAELALRAHRLLFAQKIENLKGMILAHTPTLTKHPEGEILMSRLKNELDQVKLSLRG